MMPGSNPESPSLHDHLEAAEVAAYLDQTQDQATRARVESHLAACDQCRQEIVAVRRLLHRSGKRPGWQLWAALGAAAVLLLLVWPRADNQGGPGAPVFRDGEPAATATVVLVAPDSVATLPLRMTWHALPAATTYRLSFTDASGDLVWSAATSDTAITVPDSVSLIPGRAYYYYVDALFTDGTSGTSGVHLVRLAP